ncbi:GDSL-type esterase/lipase family protein [Catenovulum sp. SX2]|uniref:GDSL-type esterase/lipase family protein n=1 Tax=Catenovulum sp. SX2 TaxID=3398614 RepID=UPI003F859CFE
MNKYMYLVLLTSLLAGCNNEDSTKDSLSQEGKDSEINDFIGELQQIVEEAKIEKDRLGESETDEDEKPEPVVVTLQENVAGFCGIDGAVENSQTGFSGDGYANVNDVTDSTISYQINAEADGDYDIEVTYAADSDRPAVVTSNDTDVALTFASSTAWDVWTTETATISLKAGLNDVVLTSTTVEGMPNIDSLAITGIGLTAGACMYTPPVVVDPVVDTQIFVVGDSTVADYGASKKPMTGWGQILQFFFEEDEIDVENRARGGRSTKSYKVDGIWSEVLNEVGDGDYVFIQFGHNDRDWTKEERYTTEAQFETYLKEYVAETRDKNAIPVLVSPMVMNAWRDGALRNVFTESGNDYAGTMAKVATELDVAYVDLNQKSWELVNSLGVEQASHYLFMQLDAGEYANYADGLNDFTHFQEAGALEMARIVVEELEGLTDRDNLKPLLDAIKPRFSLTVNQQGANDSIVTASSEYPEGTPLSFKTRAGDSDTFDAWYGAGSIVSDTNLYTATMPAANYTLTAAFNGVVPGVDFAAATVFLIGDSTVADYADGYYPQTGWGQVFQTYLDDAKITVDNRALGGRSSKSFYTDHWADVKASVQSGDFVFIQFGINDRAADDARKAPTGGTDEGFFEYYMTNFVTETRALGATPVFVTTVRRNQWQEGAPYDAYHEHPVVTRTLASDLNVPLIDLNAKNKALLEIVGEGYANEFYYMGFGANQYGNATAPADTVHFQKQGAVEMARLVAEGIKELSSTDDMAPVVAALKPTYTMSVSSTTPEAGTYSTAFSYPAGVPFTLKALANDGDQFTQWLDGNKAEVSTAYLYEFDTTDMDMTYQAVFNDSEGLGQPMTNLTTELDGTDVVLTWSLENFGDDVTYIEVYRNESAVLDGRTRIIAGATATGTYVDDTAEEGKTYWYMFKVVSGGVTINSDPEGEIRKPFVDEVPVTNLATKIVNGTSIEVSWDLQYFDPAVSYLEVHRNEVEEILGRSRIVGGAPLAGTTTDENLEPGKTYWYMFKIIQDGVTTNTSPAMPITIPADAVYIPPAEVDGPLIDPSAAVVTNLSTSINADNQIVVSWDLQNIKDGTVIELYANTSNQLGGRGRLVQGADMNGSFVHADAVAGTTYWYMFKLIRDLKTHNTDPEVETTAP